MNPLIEVVAGRRVFVTGHTGFKGTWLVHWLAELGCRVTGYALAPNTNPAMFCLSDAAQCLSANHIRDLSDGDALSSALSVAAPDLVIHMAAQALVHRGYAEPALTWKANVVGTVNVLEAVRQTKSVAAVVVVTTDKVYENKSRSEGYRESDELGGHDPYSASKAACELVVQSYRRSFFSASGTMVATARGGNVIGGGDWSDERLVADAARAAAAGTAMTVRNPRSTRPWQHVLDCLGGYLTLAGALLERRPGVNSAFNFGPLEADNVAVADLLDRLKGHWPELEWEAGSDANAPHEAAVLYLDSTKARRDLGWASRWPLETALAETAAWYREVAADANAAPKVTRRQLKEYLA